ncbi:hypothetical protein [Ensifer sp. ENS01]|uniref:hypothetical protein n=1 Tax=Ensifer sp. ENS01 TaxID=2769293 RepID=UPI00177EE9B8|nr:hypothetical protein [Ensifer sp. ENS01]MBD9497753.1 hypothetical protein [Ensifer sp. ENS01]
MSPSVTLFTIHGINAGPWQDKLASVFEPHVSSYVALKYDGYNGYLQMQGPIRLALGRGLRQTVERVNATIVEEGRKSISSYIIAHSFGTVLVTSLLQRFPAKKFDRMMFLGSAVRRDFDWGAPGFRGHHLHLTNMHGGKDEAVPWARAANRARKMPVVGRVFCDLVGDAGRVGFDGPADVVHNVVVPLSDCPICEIRNQQDRVSVHNIAFAGGLHSDYFVDPDNVHALIIPYLFGISPERYVAFTTACRAAREHERTYGINAKNDHDAAILHLPIEYQHGKLMTAGMQLKEMLEVHLDQYRISTRARQREISMPFFTRMMRELVCEAYDHPEDRRKAGALLPRIAMQRAIMSMMKKEAWRDGGQFK